ncbi:MAG TPA: hypothetical protein VEW66_06225 [Thermomicrobiales bacterium]|nr:hypothetical protein [Thermomicrobiales bacterium]
MQQQSQSTQRPDPAIDQPSTETAPEIKKETKALTALLWPAMIVLTIAIIIIVVLALG